MFFRFWTLWTFGLRLVLSLVGCLVWTADLCRWFPGSTAGFALGSFSSPFDLFLFLVTGTF